MRLRPSSVSPFPPTAAAQANISPTDRALKNRSDSLTNLQLHRIQFLDHNAVRCILKSLQNLKLIGIYQCQLLHLGNMEQLLRTIKVSAQHKGHHYSFVDLDFSPMYHEGPNSILRHGSYGAVWNHPDCDMATGIWQIVLCKLYPMARNLNIDILKWGCAFRSFLERLPMPNWANVRICEAVKSFEYTGQGWPSELDMTAYNTLEGKWERFIDEVTAALRGDGIEPGTVPGHHITTLIGAYQPTRHRKYGWWRAIKYCGICSSRFPAVFFPFGEGRCWGCLAERCLDGDWDHFKTIKTQAATAWFGKCRDLGDVTRAGSADRGYLLAQDIDKFRGLEMENNHGTDAIDWPDHPDMFRLHRRYARKYEAHGPVDRMLNDRQYMPVGSFGTSISSGLVPACYPKYELSILMGKWEVAREQQYPNEPECKRGPLRQAYLEEEDVNIEKEAATIIRRQNAEDAGEVEERRQHHDRRLEWPNRQIKCWDELIQDMFSRTAVYAKDGRPLEMPYLIAQLKRPQGPLKIAD